MDVILLINDQHAADFLGCMGCPQLQTPVADALAADGVVFDNAFCATTPCLPSRHTLFHGQPSRQTGIYSNEYCMRIDDVPPWSMGLALRDAGYRTASFGKMHWFPYHAPVERGNYFGFDVRMGHFHETGEAMQSCFPHARRDAMNAAWDERDSHNIGLGGDGDPQSFIGYDSKLPRDRHVDYWVSERAAEHVAQADRDAPMLLVSSQIGPHAPSIVPADFAGMYDPDRVPLPPAPPCDPHDLPGAQYFKRFAGLTRDDLKQVVSRYMAFVTVTDMNHGLVIDALKRAGRYADALIIYLSDHGELLGARGPESLSKYNLYERSIRVPLIIKPPRGMCDDARRGSRCGEAVTLLDILPTVLSATGVDADGACDHLPGRSLVPLLRGEPIERPHNVVLTDWVWGGSIRTSIHAGDWKLILDPNGHELYHLAEDPHEFHNLAGDSAYDGRRRSLQAAMIDHLSETDLRHAGRLARYEHQPWHFRTL